MRRLVLLVCIAVARMSFAGLDLTPTNNDVTEDGVWSRQLILKSDDGPILFSPPAGWTCRGQKDRLQLTPRDVSFAEGVVETVPGAGVPLDPAAISAFKEQATAALPQGSQAVTMIMDAENTVMPGGNPTYELLVSYQLMGKTFQRSTLLVNGPKDRLIFRFTAVKEDFRRYAIEFRRSVMSWQLAEPKPAPAGASPTPPPPALH